MIYVALPPSVVLNASTIWISSPLLISLSLSQQKPCFADGPDNLDDPFFGSLEGSGKDARCVGGGDPEAAEMRDEGPREGVGEEKRDEILAAVTGLGLRGREGDGEPEGEAANGLGGS